jgi:hypothetical protein
LTPTIITIITRTKINNQMLRMLHQPTSMIIKLRIATTNSADGNGIDKQISSKHFLFENKLHNNFYLEILDLPLP